MQWCWWVSQQSTHVHGEGGGGTDEWVKNPSKTFLTFTKMNEGLFGGIVLYLEMMFCSLCCLVFLDIGLNVWIYDQCPPSLVRGKHYSRQKGCVIKVSSTFFLDT